MSALLIAVIYLAFVSLGLPDSLLGSAWPNMQIIFSVPSSYAGYVSMTISFMTIISALMAPKIMNKLHTKWIVIISIALTVLGLLGFSFSSRYWMLFIFALPYGLGAGAIDACLNHYVASHYSSSVMNFLHCFYGLGAIISPNIMALALKYAHWNEGYRWTAYVQIGILLICILSIPLWKSTSKKEKKEEIKNAGIIESIKVPGVVLTLIAFFCYCSAESTCFIWTSSYFAGTKEGMSDELVASFGSLIFAGLMIGRLISGFVSNKLGDRLLIRIGVFIELLGILFIGLPIKGYISSAIGFLVAGIGMGPIYPSIQHMAPINFDKKYSASIISLQMAFAYIGSTFMPLIFGKLQQYIGIWMMPIFLSAFAFLNILFLELSYKRIKKKEKL